MFVELGSSIHPANVCFVLFCLFEGTWANNLQNALGQSLKSKGFSTSSTAHTEHFVRSIYSLFLLAGRNNHTVITGNLVISHPNPGNTPHINHEVPLQMQNQLGALI